MLNTLTVTNVILGRKKVSIQYSVQGEWKKFFKTDKMFYVEYDFDISGIPKSVAIIPIMGTLLTLSWLYDGEIIVNELDQEFYNSIPEFKHGYKLMYPDFEFKGGLTVGSLVNNKIQGSNSACLFSGGVDAFSTLISNINKKPVLITVWGADISCENIKGWTIVNNYIEAVSKDLSLKRAVIKSNFREIIDAGLIDRECYSLTGDTWWHGFQSGTGMLTLMAPYTYCNNIKNLYIGSSYIKEFWGEYKCSSDPVIDNYIRYNGTQVIHDGYELSRQDKIHRICEYSKKHCIDIPLRVCWESSSGTNCCNCEKCFRTITAIKTEGEDPRKYGFNYTEQWYLKMAYKLQFMSIEISHYYGTIKRMREIYKLKEMPKQIRWLYKLPIDDGVNKYTHKVKRFWEKDLNIKEMLYYILPPVFKRIYSKIKKKI